jgi:hypothetical protein
MNFLVINQLNMQKVTCEVHILCGLGTKAIFWATTQILTHEQFKKNVIKEKKNAC